MPARATALDTWRNLYWADLSGQLYALHIVNDTYFDGGALLKKDTENGAWLWGWLVPSPIPFPISLLLPLLLLFLLPLSSLPFPPSLLPLFLLSPPSSPSLLLTKTNAPPFQRHVYHQHSTSARETMIIDILPPGPGSAGLVGVSLVRKVRKRMWIVVFCYFSRFCCFLCGV